ncbi:MAG TPA: phosphoribosyltransferase family protein [Actinomycetota bacterium]|nr:phosphoribosyltransferase family protein [Actinomycetota bacterium]
MYFDRAEAGARLAEALEQLSGEEVVVLGVPRGGVEVAAAVARRRDWPLDIVVPRKLGAPFNPELGLGAIAPGVRVLDESMLRALHVDPDYLEKEIASQEEEIRRRTEAYRKGRSPVDVAGKVAVIVDDGVATGGTAAAAVRWARAQGAARVVMAIPVAPREAVAKLSKEADEVVCLATPEPFFAVGQWYERFPQTSDEEVVQLLEQAS